MLTRRRALVAIGALLMRPATGWAQTAASVRRVAWFGLGPLDAPSPYLEALRAELRDLGWIEGRNLAISRFTSTRAPEDFEAVVREIVVARLRRGRRRSWVSPSPIFQFASWQRSRGLSPPGGGSAATPG